MSASGVQICSLISCGKNIALLALVPEKYVELSIVVSEIWGFPFSQVIEDEDFLDISLGEIQQLRKFFPRLERAMLLFDGRTILFPLTLGEEVEEVTNDQYLAPDVDVIFFAPKIEVSSRRH